MNNYNPNSLTSTQSVAKIQNEEPVASPGTEAAPKFVRSKDRCHIITRTPIYDRKGNLLAYKFRYTAGEGSFRPDRIEKKHIKHIVIGFYVRRHLDQFSQQNGVAMTQLPLSSEISKYSKPLPANRFILHLQERQDSSASFQHQVNMLRRENMSIAADIYTIIYTNWFKEIRSISYAVVDMTKDIEEQFILAKTLVKKAPWIKIICDRCDNTNIASIAFEAGANYVVCPDFPRDILKANFNPYHYKVNKGAFDKVIDVIAELLEPRPDYGKFIEIIKSRNDISLMLPHILGFIEGEEQPDFIFTYNDIEDAIYDVETVSLHKLICIVCLMVLEDFYHQDKDYKYLRYEPLKQVLLRSQFIEELLSVKAGEIDLSYAFTIGVCSCLNRMYAYLTPSVEQTFNHINVMLQKFYEDERQFETAVKISECIESLSLEYVDGVMATGVYTRHEILFAYENAILWLAKGIDLMGSRRL